MRISLLNGSTQYHLAGQSGVSERTHSSAGDMRIEADAQSASYDIIGAAYGGRDDLGNVSWRISFSTSRLFETPAEAQLWSTDYDASFPRAGTLVLDAVSPGGTVSTRHLLNAIVSPPDRRVVGSTVLLNYSVEGGAIIPVSGLTHAAGRRMDWILETHAALTPLHSAA